MPVQVDGKDKIENPLTTAVCSVPDFDSGDTMSCRPSYMPSGVTLPSGGSNALIQIPVSIISVSIYGLSRRRTFTRGGLPRGGTVQPGNVLDNMVREKRKMSECGGN